MIAIFDIDGVLADATHRQHLLDHRPKDWAAFFAAVGDDPVIAAGRDRLLALASTHDVVLMSGRPESTRPATVAWLEEHDIPVSRVVLRRDADFRPADVVKAELIGSIGTPDDVAIVVDDDDRVVTRLASIGYRTELFG